MALSGNEKAYLQARSGIARSGASRSNAVWPLYGSIIVTNPFVPGSEFDLTAHILYGSLKVNLALNEAPDTASFDVMLTDAAVDDALGIGFDVLIGMGGAQDPLFGGRILTTQSVSGPARGPSRRSVMCADYLQVLDSEYLVTYGWPAQSATVTILDLVARFANRAGGIAITTGGVLGGLPNHAAFSVANERFSTVMRRIVTMFPTGGGFYIDSLKSLHAWEGASEPFQSAPSQLTLDNPLLKSFAETKDNAQQRDAVIVEGARTTAPIGSPGPDPADPSGINLQGVPVVDASIFNYPTYGGGEVRIGTQRYIYGKAEGIWLSPAGTPTSTKTNSAYIFNPDPGVEGNTVTIYVYDISFLAGRSIPFVRIGEQWIKVLEAEPLVTAPQGRLIVPRSGYGAATGPWDAEEVVTAADSLSAAATTGRYGVAGSQERVRPQPIDAEVVMTVRTAATGSSVHEQLVQDGRFSRAGAIGRGQQEVADFRDPLISIEFETEDLNAKPGRIADYVFAPPDMPILTGQLMIISADLSWPVWGDLPRRVCTAAKVQTASVLDSWLVDKR